MSWRTVVISRRAKLDFKMDYLVVREEETKRIHLSEISTLIIESTAVSMTAYLLCELIKHKIKVVFCDEKRNPASELMPYYGSHDTSGKIRSQISWDENIKTFVWTEIVSQKIRMQSDMLAEAGCNESAALLSTYVDELEIGDVTNREGHAAKVYFNSLFGAGFTRASETITNAALNYGYGIMLSAFTREIVSCGYLTQIGLCHDNQFNQFNLASDLMESFRILVDRIVYNLEINEFTHNEKMQLVNVLNQQVMIDSKMQQVNNAVGVYCRSIFSALEEKDISLIRFYRNEL